MNKIDAQHVNFFYGDFQALKDISMAIEEKAVVAFIGPSGCGKSTFLRLFNRMNDLIPGARLEGKIQIDGVNIYDKSVQVDELRKNVGMVFQRPNPFPKSIFENVAYGLRVNGVKDNEFIRHRVEETLKGAALWDEVKNKLKESAFALSGGQQQRLCIARAMAVSPSVLLMDEPASALDPISTAKVEELIHELKKEYTIVIVTHNMQQAARVSDKTAFFYMGSMVEYDDTKKIYGTFRMMGVPSEKKGYKKKDDIMVKFIESELTSLKKEVNEMWTLVYNQLDRAGESVLTFNRDLAQQVIVREKRVNAFELKIDSDVEDTIALYNPVAIDLRFVLAMFKINSDLERLGDFAEGIARFVVRSDETALDGELLRELRIEEMQRQVLGMLEMTKTALNEEDLDLALAVFGKDNLLDQINADAPGVLTKYLGKHPDCFLTCLELGTVIRKLERAGDHITNIAEEIVFFIDAKVLKHSRKVDEHFIGKE